MRMAASRVVGGGARRRAAAWRPVRACSGDAKRLRKEQLQCRSDIHTRSSGLQSGAARGERWSLPGAEAGCESAGGAPVEHLGNGHG